MRLKWAVKQKRLEKPKDAWSLAEVTMDFVWDGCSVLDLSLRSDCRVLAGIPVKLEHRLRRYNCGAYGAFNVEDHETQI